MKKRKIALSYREDNQDAVRYSKELASVLAQQGHNLFTLPNFNSLDSISPIATNEIVSLDMVIVLGGDGTFIKAVHSLGGAPVPILGANFGRLGFLVDFTFEEIREEILDILENPLATEDRALVKAVYKNKSWLAINEIVVDRGANSHLMDVSIFLEDLLVSRFRSDGVIIATPTGSTAYNLSAGGPIVHPKVSGLIVTPVCPHSLTARSILLPDDKQIFIQLNENNKQVPITVDGLRADELTHGEKLSISLSNKKVVHVLSKSSNYFQLLNKKLQFGDRS